MFDVSAMGQVDVSPMPKRERMDQLTGRFVSAFSGMIFGSVTRVRV
jgi:hypothetical protein